MFINRLKLVKFKRLMMSGINSFDITFDQMIQLIMGTNGSGKTAILLEANPSPISAKHFLQDGGKYVDISHNGKQYIIESKVTDPKTVKHFFQVDGEVLNDWGNGAVQAQLVKEHFGLDAKLNALLVGKVSFCRMDKAKRREWITQICQADFSLAFKLFELARRGANDSRGALRHNQERLVKEQKQAEQLVWRPEDETRMTTLAQELQRLMRESKQTEPSFAINQRIERLVNNFMTEAKQLLHDRSLPPLPQGASSLASLQQLLIEQTNRTAKTQGEYSQLLKNTQELADKCQVVSGVTESPTLCRQRIQVLSEDRERLRKEIITFHDVKNVASNIIERSQEALSLFRPLLTDLPHTPEGKGIFAQRVTLEQEIKTTNEKIDNYSNQVFRLNQKIQTIKAVTPVDCPSCQHRFLPGFSPDDIPKLETEIRKGEKLIEHLKTTRETKELAVEQLLEHRNKLRSLHQVMQAFPDLQPLWDKLLAENAFYDYPSSHDQRCVEWLFDIERLYEISTLNESLHQQEQLLEIAVKAESLNISNLKAQLQLQEEQLFSLKQQLSVEENQVKVLKETYQAYAVYLDAIKTQCAAFTTIQQEASNYLESTQQEVIENVIKEHQIELASLGSQQHRHALVDGIINSLKEDTAEIQLKHQSFKLLVRALGPDEGLIADTLFEFINRMVDSLNQLIEMIWEYDLKIKACKIEKGDLDFKFPYTAGLTDDIDDISEGSESQLEIIDLCFRLIAMQYLGLKQYPLYLDEFTRTFDAQHQENGLRFVNELINTNEYSQLLFITHYANVYTAFEGANICVTDPTNVVIPERYNTNVIFG